MPLVSDIFHASKNAEGGQLTWCCTTREHGKGLELFVLEEEFIEFFFFWKWPKKYDPNAPSPKAFCFFFFWKFFFFFCFFFFFFWKMKICSLSKSEEDEDEDGVKVMKIYSWWFFFEKPILWMSIILVRSWCGLLDKSLLNSCKKIISIRNGFIHWNELEVLTQCP